MFQQLKGCSITLLALAVLGALAAILGGVLFPLGDYIIREKVKKKVLIADNDESEAWEVWQDNPVPVYAEYYLFDVQNVDEVLDGAKPKLKQRGPYTYQERRVKFDIVWNKNGTVTYRQNRTFHFLPEMSVGPETDMINTLNPLIASLAQGFRYLPPFIKSTISTVLAFSGVHSVLQRRPVNELIWGYDDPILITLHRLLPRQFTRTSIGFFIRKNYTDDGLYTIQTGENDIEDLGTITRYNGERFVDAWTTPWANMVNGTDGTTAPPFMFHDRTMRVFLSDACRSLLLHYQKDVDTPQGIHLRRYTTGPLNFANASVNPGNLGFCTPQTNCLPNGLLNNTMCEKPVDGNRVPLVLSLPHFLYVDPEVQNSVEGLNPVTEHDSTLDIEPWTGFTMQIHKKAQINFFVEQVEGISQMHNIRRLFFPIMWFNESVVIDDERADKVKDQLLTPLDIILGIKIGLLALGGLLMLVVGAFFIRKRYKLSKNEICTSTLDTKQDGSTVHNTYTTTTKMVYGSNGYTKPY